LTLEVVGELGARVISLRDRRRGREWLLSGEPPDAAEARAWSAEQAVFGGRESFGWDECLPTVAPCADPSASDGPRLRDHGDQWARPTQVGRDIEAGALVNTWMGARWPYRFSRRLSCPDGDSVLAEYGLENHDDRPMPVLWSQHAVLALEVGCRLEPPGVARTEMTWQRGIDLPDVPDWPLASTRGGEALDLAEVRSGEGWAAKLYARPTGPVSAVTPDGARLTIDWDRVVAPALGIWLAYGGWPVDGDAVEQIALEPTTSGDDDLAGAITRERARWLAPGERLAWWVEMTVA
jgi:hypothetical protein